MGYSVGYRTLRTFPRTPLQVITIWWSMWRCACSSHTIFNHFYLLSCWRIHAGNIHNIHRWAPHTRTHTHTVRRTHMHARHRQTYRHAFRIRRIVCGQESKNRLSQYGLLSDGTDDQNNNEWHSIEMHFYHLKFIRKISPMTHIVLAICFCGIRLVNDSHRWSHLKLFA